MLNWARTIGPHTAELFERILNEKPHELVPSGDFERNGDLSPITR